MNLGLIKNFKNIINLKYFQFFVFLYAMGSTLNFIISSNHNYSLIKTLIYLGVIFLTFIPHGYIMNVLNNIIHEKELLGEQTSFNEIFSKSFLTATKGFCAVFLNSLIWGLFLSIVIIGTAFALKIMPAESNMDVVMKNPVILTEFLIIGSFVMLLFTLIPIAFSEKFSIKDSFRWLNIFKIFFKNWKKTIVVLLIFVFLVTILFVLMYITMFICNYLALIIFNEIVKKASVQTDVLSGTGFIFYVIEVAVPFIFSMANFVVTATISCMLANVYRESLPVSQENEENITE